MSVPLLMLAPAGVGAQGRLFSDDATVEVTIRAPLTTLFQASAKDDKASVTGTLAYRDADAGRTVVVDQVQLTVRGHTSKRENECPFPKLRLKFGADGASNAGLLSGLKTLRIGTHCGERPGEGLTEEFGRLANEQSPLREVFVYQLLRAAGVPTLRARAARITYIDEAAGAQPIVRGAMLLEDEDAARDRFGGTGEIAMDQFTNARDQFLPDDTARLAFAQALVANFDWCLRLFAGDTYRCNAKLPLWNILAAPSREACTPGQVPAGTPVDLLATEGDMAQVTLLDVHWTWAPPRDCPAVRTGQVWIERSAVGTDYPPR